jgi:hypothetical protein
MKYRPPLLFPRYVKTTQTINARDKRQLLACLVPFESQ